MKKRYVLFSVLLTICFLLSACKSTSSSMRIKEDTVSYAASGTYEEASSKLVAPGSVNLSNTETETESVPQNSDLEIRKLIKDVSMSIETKTFDDFMTSLQEEISKNSGFVQSSNISGNSYSSTARRYASVVARIPADALDQFTNQISSISNVTAKSENVKDVTMNYVDIESHIKALETERDSLLKLLESAQSLGDILSIQNRLTSVRSELDSYESQKRTYDDLISYSTVTLSITEVERETPVEQNTWQQISTNISNNLKDIGNGLLSAFVWFVSTLPYVIIIALVILIFVSFIIIKRKRRRKKEIIISSETDKPEDNDLK